MNEDKEKKKSCGGSSFSIPIPAARPSLLALCTLQALVPPSGHANPGAFFPARGGLCEAKNTGILIRFLERVIGL